MGTATVDTSQAPVPVPGMTDTYYFWIDGNFASSSSSNSDWVTLSFIPGSYSFVPGSGDYASTQATGTVSPSGSLNVTLPAAPANLAIDPNSVIRNFENGTTPLFTLTGATGVTLNTSAAPTETSTPDNFDFPVNVPASLTSSATVTVTFIADPWSFTDPGGTYNSVMLSSTQTATADSESYLDVTFQPAMGETLNTAPFATATTAPFTITGITVTPVPLKLGTSSTGAVTYRYFVSSTFAAGSVTVTFAAQGFSDTSGHETVGSTESFTVTGPTASLVNPGNSGAVGQAVIDERGFIDVPFTVPAGATL